MSDPAAAARDAAISVEVRLAGFSKRSDGGISLRFTVHPNDAPRELVDAALGTRYLMALVELDDNEEPKPKLPPNRLVQAAGIACKDPRFWRFLSEHHATTPVINETTAIMLVHSLCGVNSRKEFAVAASGMAWERLYSRYIAWRET